MLDQSIDRSKTDLEVCPDKSSSGAGPKAHPGAWLQWAEQVSQAADAAKMNGQTTDRPASLSFPCLSPNIPAKPMNDILEPRQPFFSLI